MPITRTSSVKINCHHACTESALGPAGQGSIFLFRPGIRLIKVLRTVFCDVNRISIPRSWATSSRPRLGAQHCSTEANNSLDHFHFPTFLRFFRHPLNQPWLFQARGS